MNDIVCHGREKNLSCKVKRINSRADNKCNQENLGLIVVGFYLYPIWNNDSQIYFLKDLYKVLFLFELQLRN